MYKQNATQDQLLSKECDFKTCSISGFFTAIFYKFFVATRYFCFIGLLEMFGKVVLPLHRASCATFPDHFHLAIPQFYICSNSTLKSVASSWITTHIVAFFPVKLTTSAGMIVSPPTVLMVSIPSIRLNSNSHLSMN